MPLLPKPITTTEELQRVLDIANLAAEMARGEYRERPHCCGCPTRKGYIGLKRYRNLKWRCLVCGRSYNRIGDDQDNLRVDDDRPLCVCGRKPIKAGAGRYKYWYCNSRKNGARVGCKRKWCRE